MLLLEFVDWVLMIIELVNCFVCFVDLVVD